MENQACKCNVPECGKCLAVACKNDDCPVHTIELKIRNRKNRLSWYKPDNESEGKKRLETELERLRAVRAQKTIP